METCHRAIGLHLRIRDTLSDVIDLAHQIGIPIFQSFVSMKGSGERLFVDENHIKEFIALKNDFDHIFFHASYKINPSSCTISRHYILEREIKLAQRLGLPFLILHPGSAIDCASKANALDALARTINAAQKKYSSLIFILENVAHDEPSIGSDIEDFHLLLPKLDYPDRVKFCIDTAHAFSYGYDIRTEKKREDFIQLLQNSIGLEHIVLLHINDTLEQLGSKHDQHAILGQGHIGQEALRAFAMHEKLAHIPIVLELPEVSVEEYKEIIKVVKDWHVTQKG